MDYLFVSFKQHYIRIGKIVLNNNYKHSSMLKPTEDWGKYLDDDLATNSRQD